MYKQNSASNNLQGLICHKIQSTDQKKKKKKIAILIGPLVNEAEMKINKE